MAALAVVLASFASSSAGQDSARAAISSGTDGRIVFQGARQIRSMLPNGSHVRRLTQSKRRSIEPTVSADGRHVAFVRSANGVFQIFRMRIDGSRVEQLTHGSVDKFNPAYSPTGRIGFERYDGGVEILFIMRGDGSHTHPIPGIPPATDIAFSPDGRTIAYVLPGAGYHSNLRVQELGESGRRAPAPGLFAVGRKVSFSPSGRKLAVGGCYGCGNSGGIYKISLKRDAKTRLLIRGRFRNPAWSPSGRSIAMSGGGTRGNRNIFTMWANGTDERIRLTRKAFDTAPDWAIRAQP